MAHEHQWATALFGDMQANAVAVDAAVGYWIHTVA